ncbi:N-acetyltransferase [Rhodocytophaga rosea]|uniref:N-acetyltransferase n=1 Tax=Rhodocytophaga rosea TaxID=2704465 RepID=A0A6C0GUP3_9BACT|nr:N-acetyltransferase [Rhodocytophaga rosea]
MNPNLPLTPQIREATPQDLEAILEIINHAIVQTTAVYDYRPRTMEFQQAWLAKKHADGLPVLVAEQNNHVVGFGSYGIFRPWDGYRYSAEHSIYVAHDVRGQGIGKKLMEGLIEKAKAQQFHTLIAGIDADNRISYEFHLKYGFVEVGRFREVGHKFDRWLDLVFMQLML